MRKHAKNLFIPNEGNEYKPHILQRISIVAMLVLILLSFTAANIQALLWIGSDWLVSTILPAVIVERTNEERADDALTTLARNSTLDIAAQRKAEHMAENEYFAHYSPDGVSPWYWFDEVSYPFVHAGENLAVHFTDSDEVVTAWMNSPGHRANILNGNFTEIGVGTARGTYQGFDTVYVVQLFGTPAASAQTLANTSGTLESTASAPEEEITIEIATQDDNNDPILPASIETVAVSQQEEQDEYEEETGTSSELAIVDVNETEDSVVIYSGLATASRDAIPATTTLQSTSGTSPEAVTAIARTATQPSTLLQLFYSMLALLVIAALTLSVVIEWRRQHPVQIAYGTGLLAVMALLMYVHTSLTSGVTIM